MLSKYQKQTIRIFCAVFLSATISQAQLIGIKTVPVVEMAGIGSIYSSNMGIGGLSIALDDPGLDIFARPVKGINYQGLVLNTAPVFSGVTEELGSTKILPLGLFYGDSVKFGGLNITYQQAEKQSAGGNESLLSDPENYALNLAYGQRFKEWPVTVAGAISWAKMNYVPGVDFLYRQSDEIRQEGDIWDIRLGAGGTMLKDQRWDITLVFNRISIEHTIQSFIWRFDDIGPNKLPFGQSQKEEDLTNTYGLSLEYSIPWPENGWRLTGQSTFNYKNHPKIPNYTLMNIPRDPGYGYAGQIGIGLGKETNVSRIGLEIMFEPIRSRTWANAAEEMFAFGGKKSARDKKRFTIISTSPTGTCGPDSANSRRRWG